jgi:pimeloyl-ACP methyl ester carboxylesterase
VDKSPHKSEFVNANGIRLHYLDWGGSGLILLFIPGLGCNAHIFDTFAPRFTDKFRVLAVTRRGHGESDHPETGYDVDTLAEDLHQFLDALKINKVILAGHSMAHLELSHFTALHPERVLGLIYLDSAYDGSTETYRSYMAKNPLLKMSPPNEPQEFHSVEEYFASIRKCYPALDAIWGDPIQEQGLHEITIDADGKIVDTMSETIAKACRRTLDTYIPEESKIKVPALGIFAISNGCYYIADWMTEEQKTEVSEFLATENYAMVTENIEAFKRNMPHARVLVIPEGHHYCFIKKEEEVFQAMRKFLKEIA